MRPSLREKERTCGRRSVVEKKREGMDMMAGMRGRKDTNEKLLPNERC